MQIAAAFISHDIAYSTVMLRHNDQPGDLVKGLKALDEIWKSRIMPSRFTILIEQNDNQVCYCQQRIKN